MYGVIGMFIYFFVLFFVLTPGQLVTLPSNHSSKMVVNSVHALLFSLVWLVTHKMVWRLTNYGKK